MEDTKQQVKPFSFAGTAAGYFSVWIVNILLTIVTLGIYSAWAKVRTNQYFYGHTQLDGSSFQYLATPMQILRGRIFACLALLAYLLADWISPIAGIAAIVILFAALPFIFVAAMSFRMRHTAYRGVTFAFKGDILQAYLILLLPTLLFFGAIFLTVWGVMPEEEGDQVSMVPMLIMLGVFLLAGLFTPLVEFFLYRYVTTGVRYGQSAFRFGAGHWDFYKIYAVAVGVFLLFGIVIGLMAGGINMAAGVEIGEGTTGAAGTGITLLMAVAGMVLYLWLFAYFKVARENLLYNNLQLEQGHYFESRLRVGYMMFLIFTNTLAVVVSLGLLLPWAKVRTAKYRASTLVLVAVADLNDFAAGEREQVRALGEEVDGVFDLEIGI
ncbi:YjgN family protein [Exilibacterium tricleocarpae]|nr:YjgN family protein [Exilibacterium tricleocarpae]